MPDANYKNTCYACARDNVDVSTMSSSAELQYSLNDSYPNEPQPQYPAEPSSPFQIKPGDYSWVVYVIIAILVVVLVISLIRKK